MNRPTTRRESLRRAGAAALVAGLSGAGLLLAVPSGAGLPPDVRVIDSHAAAAAVGVLSRVPAETDGGAVYTSSAITLDKTQAKAAGFTAGDLAESFSESSSDKYRNPTLINAQYPPAGTVPAEAAFDAAGAPQGAPVTGGAGHLHAVATEAPSAAAEADGARAMLGDVTVGGATSASSGLLAADGTLVSTARSIATDVRIAKVLTLASATTVVEARVPRTGAPTTALDVKLAGVALAGIPAEITADGIRISDKAATSPVTVAQFNAALAQLQEKGITVVAAPLVQVTGAGAAQASGGGVRIRYKVADQIGGDEELTLAPASARSAVARREAEPPALDGATPPAPDAPGPITPDPVPPAGSGNSTLPGTGALATTAGPADVAYDFRSGATSSANAGTTPTGVSAGPSSGPSSGSNVPATTTSPVSTSDAALPAAHRKSDPAHRVRTGYTVLLLVAAAGVAAVTAQGRVRPA
ncbi:MAG: hypothetical protein QOF96_2930 [Actinomycetota bacterium]|nr:hypothetical protein [Actinomycetota bacterium]